MSRRLSLIAAFLGCGHAAWAHQPIISDGTAIDAASALEFDDVQVSRVVYHEVTEFASQVWITFEVDEAQSLDVSLGVPAIDRLTDYRPAFAILGPGLPDVEIPFEVPDGVGGVLFYTDDIAAPEVFYEPFSCTTSWIWLEELVDLPQAGRYYVVAFHPLGLEGKLWIATGVEEKFPIRDLLAIIRATRAARAFHEVPRSRREACRRTSKWEQQR